MEVKLLSRGVGGKKIVTKNETTRLFIYLYMSIATINKQKCLS